MAVKAAAAEITPSMTMGTWCCAPPKNTPTKPAMSKPPTLCKTSNGSSAFGRFTSMARAMASIFLCRPALLSPAPLPVISVMGRSSSTDRMALLVVVLPMPISPVAIRLYPCCFNSPTICIPYRMASAACSRLMAGPCVMSAVPFAILWMRRPLPLTVAATPMSTGKTSAPAARAIAQTLV